jgi:hypothetical protein
MMRLRNTAPESLKVNNKYIKIILFQIRCFAKQNNLFHISRNLYFISRNFVPQNERNFVKFLKFRSLFNRATIFRSIMFRKSNDYSESKILYIFKLEELPPHLFAFLMIKTLIF